MLVGAIYYDDGERNEGGAWLYLGSATGLETTPAWSAEPDVESSWFGSALGSAGDVNGDGYDDVAVGGYGYEDGESSEGAVFVYHGSAAGLATTPDWVAEGDQLNAIFGFSVASAGDVNADGYGDLVVGSPFYKTTVIDEGAAFLYLGSAAGLDTSPD